MANSCYANERSFFIHWSTSPKDPPLATVCLHAFVCEYLRAKWELQKIGFGLHNTPHWHSVKLEVIRKTSYQHSTYLKVISRKPAPSESITKTQAASQREKTQKEQGITCMSRPGALESIWYRACT